MSKSISLKDSVNDLLDTDIFKLIAKRNGNRFAMKLALWLVRYILIISSINETSDSSLEMILSKLHHEDNFKKILMLTEQIFKKVYNQSVSLILER